jgi:hypothetical protein
MRPCYVSHTIQHRRGFGDSDQMMSPLQPDNGPTTTFLVDTAT